MMPVQAGNSAPPKKSSNQSMTTMAYRSFMYVVGMAKQAAVCVRVWMCARV